MASLFSKKRRPTPLSVVEILTDCRTSHYLLENSLESAFFQHRSYTYNTSYLFFFTPCPCCAHRSHKCARHPPIAGSSILRYIFDLQLHTFDNSTYSLPHSTIVLHNTRKLSGAIDRLSTHLPTHISLPTFFLVLLDGERHYIYVAPPDPYVTSTFEGEPRLLNEAHGNTSRTSALSGFSNSRMRHSRKTLRSQNFQLHSVLRERIHQPCNAAIEQLRCYAVDCRVHCA